MSRAYLTVLALALALGWACQPQEGTEEEVAPADTAEQAMTEPGPDVSTPEGKITSAESAGPEEIAANATIMDWPATEGGEMVELRKGTNGWTCFPTTPQAAGAAGEDPMCLDAEWLAFAQAWMTKTQPSVGAVGVGYMLRGDEGASNTDPYATEPTADNEWVEAGPHIMVITPDAAQLEALPTDPQNGGPWIMWKGTPYAHVMIPVESPEGS